MSAARFVHLNGSIVAASSARISVFDRGLLYGDGLLETLRCYGGEPFALERHLARLRASADFLRIPVPKTDWLDAIDVLLRRSRLKSCDAWVRITLTRGPGQRGLEPPARPVPTLLITAGKVDPAITTRQLQGVRLASVAFCRDPFLAKHKTLNYLPNILAKIAAAHAGVDDALFVDHRGRIVETTTANIFVWKGGELWTPKAGALPGVTRDLVVGVARERGISVRERSITLPELTGADEAFLTSSLVEVVPVVGVAAAIIGRGRRGPRTRELQQAYKALRRA